jgi:rhodanese-related sulfurtransferase
MAGGPARELDTREVVDVLLQEPRQAVLLDAYCGLRSLPGSQCIVGAGIAYDDEAADKDLASVLQKALAALVPNRDTRIVVFGASTNDWRAVNAVLRIGKLGYPNVDWYRGGVSAWREAGLPHVQTAPLASVVK